MIGTLWTVFLAGLLLLGIVIIYGCVVAVALNVSHQIQIQRQKHKAEEQRP